MSVSQLFFIWFWLPILKDVCFLHHTPPPEKKKKKTEQKIGQDLFRAFLDPQIHQQDYRSLNGIHQAKKLELILFKMKAERFQINIFVQNFITIFFVSFT